MRALIALAIALTAAVVTAQAGTNCRTTCTGSGATRTCNTYCF